MANEKKNGTLEEIIVEMLKEGKAVHIPLKDVVDKMQENVKAAEDAQEAVQPETEKSEAGLSTLFQTNFFRLFFRYCTGV